jgi:hypothetical protein
MSIKRKKYGLTTFFCLQKKIDDDLFKLKEALKLLVPAEFVSDEDFISFISIPTVREKVVLSLKPFLHTCQNVKCKKIVKFDEITYITGCIKHGFHKECLPQSNSCKMCLFASREKRENKKQQAKSKKLIDDEAEDEEEDEEEDKEEEEEEDKEEDKEEDVEELNMSKLVIQIPPQSPPHKEKTKDTNEVSLFVYTTILLTTHTYVFFFLETFSTDAKHTKGRSKSKSGRISKYFY